MIRASLSGNTDALLKRVADVFGGAARDRVLLGAGKVMGAAAEQIAVVYPQQTHKPLPLYYTRKRRDGTTYKSKFKSAAQQGLVMSLAAQGRLPYRRTGFLGRSVTSRADAEGKVVIVSIGTNVNYAPYLLDEARQSHYHQGNWTTMHTNLVDNLDFLRRAAAAEVNTAVREMLSGKA